MAQVTVKLVARGKYEVTVAQEGKELKETYKGEPWKDDRQAFFKEVVSMVTSFRHQGVSVEEEQISKALLQEAEKGAKV